LDKAPEAFRTISEVAEDLDLPQHVLRFWESRFPQIRPMKRGGGRRYYRPDDVDLLRGIRHLLYSEGYTIRGVQRILREQGGRFVQTVWQEGAPPPPPDARADDDDAEEKGGHQAPGKPGLFTLLPQLFSGEAEKAERVTREPGLREINLAQHLPAAAEPASTPLSDVDRDHLRAVLNDLAECKRLLDEALADGVDGTEVEPQILSG
jgi:DNA-binding transcriptional MerR regulator